MYKEVPYQDWLDKLKAKVKERYKDHPSAYEYAKVGLETLQQNVYKVYEEPTSSGSSILLEFLAGTDIKTACGIAYNLAPSFNQVRAIFNGTEITMFTSHFL